MKLTFQCGRIDHAGRHNDRNFDLSLSDHINPYKSEDNKYWTYDGSTDKSFQQLELEFYKEHFQAHLQKQNEKNKRAGHSERNLTISQYYRRKNTRPQDVILQIGNVNEHPSPEATWKIALRYIEMFNNKFSSNCQILNAALHVDEESVDAFGNIVIGTPHVHIRRVWISKDKDDLECVSQAGALRLMEDASHIKTSRKVNSQSLFTEMERNAVQTLCQAIGIEIETSKGDSHKHLSVNDYKDSQRTEQLEHISRQVEDLLRELPGYSSVLTDERVLEVEDESPDQKLDVITTVLQEKHAALMGAMNREMLIRDLNASAMEEARKYRKKYEFLKNFLKEKYPSVFKAYQQVKSFFEKKER